MPQRSRLVHLAAVLPIVVAVTLTACSPPANKSFGEEEFTPKGSRGGDVKVGVVGNFSGPISYVGNAMLAGAQHAADVLNENDPQGVNGAEIELVKCDVQFSASTAVNCLTKMVSIDGVDMIMVDTPLGLDTMGPEKTKALGVPVYMPALAEPDMAATAMPNVFAMGRPLTESTDLQVLSEFLVKTQGRSRIAIIGGDDEFFTAVGDELVDDLAALGVTPTTRERFTFGDVDVSAQVQAAAKTNPETIVCLGLGADCARVALAMERAGVDAQLAGMSTLYMRAFRELAKNASNDAVFTLPHSKTNDVDPAFLQWLFDFFRRYGFKTFSIGGSVAPDYPGLELPAYQALDVYAKAARIAGSTATEAIIEAMHRPEGYDSVGVHRVWPPGSAYPTLDPDTEPWMTRFVNGHISWDIDPRAVPALEDARIAWEEQMFQGTYETDIDFIIAAAETFRKELEARKDALVAAEGQAKYDQRIAELDEAINLAEQARAEGDERDLPDL
ncbi:MAG: ABC transporter substrate-binding protein [Acidimicrobiia bacterium]|nr:ABC transporter substrate-binding protein [Acidimicrobiia bacterium]